MADGNRRLPGGGANPNAAVFTPGGGYGYNQQGPPRGAPPPPGYGQPPGFAPPPVRAVTWPSHEAQYCQQYGQYGGGQYNQPPPPPQQQQYGQYGGGGFQAPQQYGQYGGGQYGQPQQPQFAQPAPPTDEEQEWLEQQMTKASTVRPPALSRHVLVRRSTGAPRHRHVCLPPRPSPRPLTTFALCAALAQPAAPSNASFRPEEDDDEPEPVMPSAAAQPTPAADEKAPGDYDDVRECLANAPPPPLTPPPHRGRRHRCRGGPSLIHT